MWDGSRNHVFYSYARHGVEKGNPQSCKGRGIELDARHLADTAQVFSKGTETMCIRAQNTRKFVAIVFASLLGADSQQPFAIRRIVALRVPCLSENGGNLQPQQPVVGEQPFLKRVESRHHAFDTRGQIYVGGHPKSTELLGVIKALLHRLLTRFKVI